MKKLLSIMSLAAMVLCMPLVAHAGDVNLTSEGKVPGQPFQVLQDQVDQLRIDLENIELTLGPQGLQGPQGEQGPPGTCNATLEPRITNVSADPRIPQGNFPVVLEVSVTGGDTPLTYQ